MILFNKLVSKLSTQQMKNGHQWRKVLHLSPSVYLVVLFLVSYVSNIRKRFRQSDYLLMIRHQDILAKTLTKLNFSEIMTGEGIPFTGLNPSHVCACLEPRPGFQTQYVLVFLCSMIGCERWLFVSLILLEFVIITVKILVL